MCITIDISASQLHDLAAIAACVKQPRAALMRQAIADYLTRNRQTLRADAFGLWGADAPDGLACQILVREEW